MRIQKSFSEIDIRDLYKEWEKLYPDLIKYLSLDEEVQELRRIDNSFKIINNACKGKNSEDIIKIDESFMLGSIQEASVAELRRAADKARLDRSKKIRMRYRGVTNSRGWIRFDCTSQHNPNKTYSQYIVLTDIKDIKHFKGYKKKDIVRLLMYGNVRVHCNCKDFRYRGFRYMGSQMGYGIFREKRFPKIKNPKLEGTVCKHLLAVFGVFMNNWLSIYKDLVRSKAWNKNLEEDIKIKKK